LLKKGRDPHKGGFSRRFCRIRKEPLQTLKKEFEEETGIECIIGTIRTSISIYKE
jgi:8-oxo-dGTP pyrophosphatase MutT (NUDIX family)